MLISGVNFPSRSLFTHGLKGSGLPYKISVGILCHVLTFSGTLLILTVLKRRLNLSDEVVGALSCLSFVLTQFGLIVAASLVVVFASKILFPLFMRKTE